MQRSTQPCSYFLTRRGIAGDSHPHSVTGTLCIATEQVEREAIKVGDLLRMCAFLQANASPEELFLIAMPDIGDVLNPDLLLRP
jgi:hypothetical protein